MVPPYRDFAFPLDVFMHVLTREGGTVNSVRRTDRSTSSFRNRPSTSIRMRCSARPAHSRFRRIEHHERYQDSLTLPHVLIVEARKGAPQPERPAALQALIEREFLRHLTD